MNSQRWECCLALEHLLLLHLFLATSIQGTLRKSCACNCALKARVRWERGYRVGLSPESGVWSPGSRYFYAGSRAVVSWATFLSPKRISLSLFSQGVMTKTGPQGDGGAGSLDLIPCFVVWV